MPRRLCRGLAAGRGHGGITLGEGWHNNHRRHPGATRQRFFWWEIDLTYYGLVTLQWLRVIRDLRPVPRRLLEAG